MTEILDFAGPIGLRTRGTVLVVAGRGESPSSYGRFGRRLAADAYHVRVLPAPQPDVTLSQLGDALAAAVGPDPVSPVFLLGADTGAAALAALVATPDPGAAWWPAGLVLAGLPGYDGPEGAGSTDELDLRTHCPTHRGVLADDPAARPGAFARPVPAALLDAAYHSTTDVPHLVLIGDLDPFADRDRLRGLAKSLPAARLCLVGGAHHDVLNDLQHRSVAAEVVTFLESLRNGTPLAPIVHVESTAW